MRGVLGLGAIVVVACSSSYADGGPAPASDSGATNDSASASDIEVTPSELDFGKGSCGDTSAAQLVVLRNHGTTKTPYQLQIPDGAAFEVLGPLTGELAPDSVTALNVVAKPTIAGDTVANIVVTAGAKLAQVTLKAKGDGGKLEISPSAIDLGGVRRENGGSADVSFVNTGTLPITVTSLDSSLPDFVATWTGKPAPLTLEPNTPHTVTVTLAPGSDSPVLDSKLTPHASGALCGVLPTLPVKGQRVNNDVTISAADFGSVACQSSPTVTRFVVVSNYSASTLAYVATLDKSASSAFTILAGGSDSIAPGSATTPATKTIKLGMKAVGGTLGALSETLTVEISGIAAPAGGKRAVNLSATVHGVVLGIAPADLTGFQRGQVKYFNVTNTGNDDATITTSFVRDADTKQTPAWYNQFPSTVIAGATKQGVIQFGPGAGDYGTYGGTFTVTSSPALCNGPVTLHVQGNYSN